jgi:hypothetical protein
METHAELMGRLDAAARTLSELAERETPSGLTEPDPGADERWEAGQVWSHIDEFIPYWHRQIESVVGAYDGTPVPFGRTKADLDRLAGIELGRTEPIENLAARASESVESAKRYLDGLLPAQWSAVGLHPVRGEMTVESMATVFLANHLEEHVEQLDGLT